MHDDDILIAGGGIAGLTAALALGSAGFSVLCVDPAPPPNADAPAADLRTTAILQPGQRLLDRTGLWTDLAPIAAPLQTMRIVDAGAADETPDVVCEFAASDLSELPFGWNIANRQLLAALHARIDTLENVTFRPGCKVTGYLGRSTEARMRLDTGETLRARLAIAADGRHSPTRAAAGIGTRTMRYGQKALAFTVTHTLPHGNISTEIHRTGGPFTLVPLPDRNGQPASAVVWMDEGPECLRRMDLDAAAFEAEMTDRSRSLLGPLSLASPRSLWPIISQEAERLTAPRLALIAEAAHVVPPIGAQGLNMSLRDIEDLLNLASDAPEALGSAAMLDQYARARQNDIRLRVGGIALLNRASQARAPLLRSARRSALQALYSAPPLRKLLMEMGLGAKRLA